MATITVSPYLARPCRPLTQALAEVQMARAIEEASRIPDLACLVPGWRAALKEARGR